ncbi:MAG: hypothetical protein KIT80_16910 [Chitinophagaceae bacterium]|nr:hypothetical protein [Chitinophagaceae bacterium]MCW5928601.1 hypothetical protein [Chitinophagaceae bacterium]
MVLNGSGRLYKAGTENGRVVFKRLDSTVYYGSNFGSYIFSHKDTIFSLGGYGFWKTNGLLRYYVPSRKEWEIIRLNREIPVFTENVYDLIWYDEPEQKLYFGFTREENNVTKDNESGSKLHMETIVLDLLKKDWITQGNLSPFLKDNLIGIRNIISSPLGQMITLRGKALFLNYQTNQIFSLTDDKQRKLEQLSSNTGATHTAYFIDSTLYLWLTEMNIVDSMKIIPQDLVLMNEKIFLRGKNDQAAIEKQSFSFKTASYGFFAATILLWAIYFLLKTRRTHSQPVMGSDNGADEPNGHFMIAYTASELDLIRTVLNNSINGMYTSIEDTNKILGVKNRDVDIQKKARHDTISAINKKYAFATKSEKDLIEKKRAAFDRRSFEYFIGSDRLKDAAEIIDSNT